MSKLLQETIRPYGVNRDVGETVVDPSLWNYVKGADFSDQATNRQTGYVFQIPQPLFAPERIIYRFFDGLDQWLYAGQDGIGVNEAGAQSDITPGTWPLGMEVGKHNWTDLNGIPIWNHPENDPYYHGGDTSVAMEALPGWPSGWRCQVMRSFKFFLLALNIDDNGTNYDNQVRWSDEADVGNVPSTWTPAPGNLAGDMFFADEPGEIVDGLSLRDGFMVYKPASSYVMQFIGDPFVFQQKKVFPTTGILAPNCVAERRGTHFLVSQGDILVHDGNQAQSVVDKVVRREIFDNIDAAQVGISFVAHDPSTLTMNFYYPSRSSAGWCDLMATWNYRDNIWTINETGPDEFSHAAVGNYVTTGIGGTWDEQTAPLTWDTWGGQWDDAAESGVAEKTIQAVAAATEFAQPVDGYGRNDQPITTTLQWLGKDMGLIYNDAPNMVTNIDRIWIDAESGGNAELSVRVGFQDKPNGAIAWNSAKPFVIGQDEFVSILAKGRISNIEIAAATLKDFCLNGMTVHYRLSRGF